ncbi:glyoxalase [Klebsiella quasipneumoniae]|nr:glyoxalase [Klebsiella quasipneumoniae]
MNILGPDYLVFGVDDLAGCRQFLIDYGLREQENGFFSALDGTGVLLRGRDDPSLPAALPSGSQLRETVYGVADSATLEAIAETLRRDREVKLGADGVLRCVDDAGFALGFRVSQRQPLQREGEKINAPGDRAGRPVNQTGPAPTWRRSRVRSPMWSILCRTPRARKLFINGWALSVPIASPTSAPSCDPPAPRITIPCF